MNGALYKKTHDAKYLLKILRISWESILSIACLCLNWIKYAILLFDNFNLYICSVVFIYLFQIISIFLHLLFHSNLKCNAYSEIRSPKTCGILDWAGLLTPVKFYFELLSLERIGTFSDFQPQNESSKKIIRIKVYSKLKIVWQILLQIS